MRVVLDTMRASADTVIPLPLRWTVRASLHGLAAVAYPQGRPEDMTVLAPRELRIAAPARDAE